MIEVANAKYRKRRVQVMDKRRTHGKRYAKDFLEAVSWLGAFGVWTGAVTQIDVRPIGQLGSEIGFASLNEMFHRLTGVNWFLYHLTDWLSVIPLGVVMCFGILGLIQWIRRKRLRLVDGDLLLLGGFYLIVMLAYLLFEVWTVNYRPVLINGFLEPSYPSSTTMLVICVMSTVAMQLRIRIKNKRVACWGQVMAFLFSVFMVVGRALSGVHWITDIVGGVLLSVGLVRLYAAINKSVILRQSINL